ncbi:hypothetical protein G9A89_014465 [Geosiphon pyriformis]|nr:hypothetical protein G9A89_014465 [Geosiphon pyriformis]
MTTTRTKSKKAAPDICPEISNKISNRETLSVVKATRQNVLEAFPLPSNHDKLSLIATEATSLSLAGFLPVKVLSKRHTWFLHLVLLAPPLQKMVKKTKSSEKWGQSFASAIVTPNLFVVPNKILDEISIASSGTSFKIGQDQPLAVLLNMVSSGRSSPIVEAKQSLPVGSPVLGNWTDQMKTDSSPPLVSGATSGGA